MLALADGRGQVLITRLDRGKEQVLYHLWQRVESDQGREVSDKPLVGGDVQTLLGPNDARSGSIEIEIADELTVTKGGPDQTTQSVSIQDQLRILDRMERAAERIKIQGRTLEGVRTVEEAVVRNLNVRDTGRGDNIGVVATLDFQEILRADVESDLRIRVPALEDPGSTLSDADQAAIDALAADCDLAKEEAERLFVSQEGNTQERFAAAVIECTGVGEGTGLLPQCIRLPTVGQTMAEQSKGFLGALPRGIDVVLGAATGNPRGISDTARGAIAVGKFLADNPEVLDPTGGVLSSAIRLSGAAIERTNENVAKNSNLISEDQLQDADLGLVVNQLKTWKNDGKVTAHGFKIGGFGELDPDTTGVKTYWELSDVTDAIRFLDPSAGIDNFGEC